MVADEAFPEVSALPQKSSSSRLTKPLLTLLAVRIMRRKTVLPFRSRLIAQALPQAKTPRGNLVNRLYLSDRKVSVAAIVRTGSTHRLPRRGGNIRAGRGVCSFLDCFWT